MDDPSVGYATFRGCLHDLARVNRLSLGYRPTLAFLEGLRRAGRLGSGAPWRSSTWARAMGTFFAKSRPGAGAGASRCG
jgi:hypothetical protein